MKEDRILILYANYGEGHKSAARAIEAKIQRDIPEATIIVSDFLGDAFPVSDWIMRKLYLQTFTWAKPIYRQLYYKTKDNRVNSQLFTLPSTLSCLKLERYLKQIKPTIVISTFPTLTGMLSVVKDRGKIDFDLYCVLTDYVTHSQWLYHSVDRYFVPTEGIRNDLVRRGIPASSIQIASIPVMPKFEANRDRSFLREKWGLTNEAFVVLISAGAFGVVNIKEACVNLIRECPSLQFVVVCGRNDKLYNQLKTLPEITPVPFTNEMHELMQLSDLFVTKAGGLSVSEAITCELPMLLYKSLPGQETENVKYLIRQRIAKRVKSTKELSKAVLEILETKGLIGEMRENIRNLRERNERLPQLTESIKKDIRRKNKEVDLIRLREKRLYEI
ncbi:MAG TPA: glycosyltransferase [Candidatus Angelobacter sp.]|nr:glycosyltransferase [Candidatus Angelobacter sp.]